MKDKQKSRHQLLEELNDLRLRLGEAPSQGEEGSLCDQVRESESVCRALFSNMDAGVALMDREFNVLACNSTLAGMFGLAREDLIDRKCHKVLQEREGICPFCPGMKALRQKTRVETEIDLVTPASARLRCVYKAFPVLSREGAVMGFITLVRDVTAEREKWAGLVRQKEETEAAERAKTRFLAGLSNELRSPLNGIFGMVELLKESGLDSAQKSSLEMINRSAMEMSKLVGNLHDLAAIETGQASLRESPFSIREVMATAFRSYQVRAKLKGLDFGMTVDSEVPDTVIGDESRLAQILSTLISNAVRYTDRGDLHLKCRPFNEPGDDRDRVCFAGLGAPNIPLLFTVTDSGPGIPAQRMETVFDAIAALGGKSPPPRKGQGLGLTIAKRVVERMGGSIWVDNLSGGGSCFHFTCVFRLEDAVAVTLDSEPVAERKKFPNCLRILVVEDEDVSRLSTAGILRNQGHEVEEAQDGRVAMDLLASRRFDLVFMDIQMPVIDGLEVVRRLRSGKVEGENRNTPVVALTAYATVMEKERFLEAGLNEVVAKPVTASDLAQAVSEALDR